MGLTDDGVLTRRVIECATEVHRYFGPGLLESIYEEALCHEFSLAGIEFVRQQTMPVIYDGREIGCDFVLNLVVEQTLVLEVKCLTRIEQLDEAKLMSFLRASGFPHGLLLNFNEEHLEEGIRGFSLAQDPITR